MRWLLPLVMMACSAGGEDLDLDGFAADEDCDDSDPSVYPGAPDFTGDGVDADCDGVDLPYAFLGGWTLAAIEASYFSLDAIDPTQTDGSMTIESDLTLSMLVNLEIREDLIGFPLNAPLDLTGTVSALPGPDRFAMIFEGELFGEAINGDWLCGIEDGMAACDGSLKALDITFDVATAFEPE